jgi:UPF0755 protein
MTADYRRPEPPPWQVRLIRAFVVVVVIVVSFVGITKVAAKLASGISNEGTVQADLVSGLSVNVVIDPGSTARAIGSTLVEAGVIADGGGFQDAVQARGAADQLKAGTYTMVTGSDYDALIDILVAGPDPIEVKNIRVIEGLTIQETLQSLAEQTPYTVAQLAAPLLNGTVTSPYLPDAAPDGYPEITRWEGLLAPDTYEFAVDASPETIVGRMADTLTARMNAIDWSILEGMDLDPYDGLIIASLIEREAKLDDERATIASVITNRLELGMPLQIDATIIYALGTNSGEVTTADLEVDSPYNTYQHTGLPPTPIAGVRTASIEAAARPDVTNYLYYVLIDKDGTHGFSETLEEHNRLKEEAKANGVLTP